MKPRPILAVHTGGVGDFICAIPAIAWLSREGPVTLWGRPERIALAAASGHAVAACSLDAVGFSSVFTGSPSPLLREAARPFQRAVVWMSDGDGAIRGALYECGIERVECHPGLPQAEWRTHASAYYLATVGAEPRPRPPMLDLGPCPGGSFPGALIHPGSGSARKDWPLARYLHVAAGLDRLGCPVRWVLGPAEGDRGLCLPPPCELLTDTSLVELGRILSGAVLYLGNDSGVTHLAAAVGCPTLAIFGPEGRPATWAPQGDRVRVLGGPAWPSADQVLEAAASLLEQSRTDGK